MTDSARGLFCALRALFAHPCLCFQPVTDSFAKYRGWGINSNSAKTGHAFAFPPRSIRTHFCPPLCFHAIANPSFCKSRLFTSMQIAGGVPLNTLHSMSYIAVQCSETPFRERFGGINGTPVNWKLLFMGAPRGQFHLWVRLRLRAARR